MLTDQQVKNREDLVNSLVDELIKEGEKGAYKIEKDKQIKGNLIMNEHNDSTKWELTLNQESITNQYPIVFDFKKFNFSKKEFEIRVYPDKNPTEIRVFKGSLANEWRQVSDQVDTNLSSAVFSAIKSARMSKL